MAYEFKRLTDVEELTEAPENATALAVVDGTVKRVPLGGGGNANLEDLMFDLDVDMPSDGMIYFTNAEQLQKAYDNNMSIHIHTHGDVSGMRMVRADVFPSIKDTMVVYSSAPSYTSPYAYLNGYYSINGYDRELRLKIDYEKYVSDGSIEIILDNNSYIYFSSGYTVDRVYASVF